MCRKGLFLESLANVDLECLAVTQAPLSVPAQLERACCKEVCDLGEFSAGTTTCRHEGPQSRSLISYDLHVIRTRLVPMCTAHSALRQPPAPRVGAGGPR